MTNWKNLFCCGKTQHEKSSDEEKVLEEDDLKRKPKVKMVHPLVIREDE